MFKYEKPFMEVVEFEDEVITASGDSKSGNDTPKDAKGGDGLFAPAGNDESPFVGDTPSIVEEKVG